MIMRVVGDATFEFDDDEIEVSFQAFIVEDRYAEPPWTMVDNLEWFCDHDHPPDWLGDAIEQMILDDPRRFEQEEA